MYVKSILDVSCTLVSYNTSMPFGYINDPTQFNNLMDRVPDTLNVGR